GEPQKNPTSFDPFFTKPNDTFYLSAIGAFAQLGARITLQVQLKTKGTASGPAPTLAIAYRHDGHQTSAWTDIKKDSQNFADKTAGLTTDGHIQFRMPANAIWPMLDDQWTGCWLRFTVDDVNNYTQIPEIASIEASYDWAPLADEAQPFPVKHIDITFAEPNQPGQERLLTPKFGAYNEQSLDLTKPFHPFGTEPQTYD
ncbi:MAG: hypothetical protein GY796_28600, partial [Chloroflexi bacterium]|nr:hypothetical protein [Chloroflexota bacterium]